MNERSAKFLGGLSGILYVVLWIIGFFAIVGSVPVLDSTDQEIQNFL